MTNQKGNISLVVIIVVIVGLLVGVYLVQQTTNLLPRAKSPGQSPSTQAIQSSSDLTRVGQELDGENLEVIDSQLSQNDSDLNSF